MAILRTANEKVPESIRGQMAAHIKGIGRGMLETEKAL
jgi:hypothetical protein